MKGRYIDRMAKDALTPVEMTWAMRCGTGLPTAAPPGLRFCVPARKYCARTFTRWGAAGTAS